MTEVIKEAVEALHAALSCTSSIGNFRVGTPAEVIKHLAAKGFTITRIETSPSDTTYPAQKVEIPDGFKYTAAQQAVWDWWFEHQKAPPVCDDLNNLVWHLDALKDGTICNLAAEKLRLIYSLQTCLDVIKEASGCSTIESATYNSSPILSTIADHLSNAKEVAEIALELSLINKDGRSDPAMTDAELELEAFQLAVDIWECGAERDRKNDTDKCKKWIVELAKKYRG